MPTKSVLPRGFMAEAERISERYREELGISKFDPLTTSDLAKHLGVGVFTVDEIFQHDKNDASYLKMSDVNRFSAMWLPTATGNKMIIHNSNHSYFRQQSNVMHELAHIIRNHTVPDATATLCAQFNLHYYNALHEQEAKYLGGCLQITRPGILWALKNISEVEKISSYFSASTDMVRYRMSITGASKQLSYQNY